MLDIASLTVFTHAVRHAIPSSLLRGVSPVVILVRCDCSFVRSQVTCNLYAGY